MRMFHSICSLFVMTTFLSSTLTMGCNSGGREESETTADAPEALDIAWTLNGRRQQVSHRVVDGNIEVSWRDANGPMSVAVPVDGYSLTWTGPRTGELRLGNELMLIKDATRDAKGNLIGVKVSLSDGSEYVIEDLPDTETQAVAVAPVIIVGIVLIALLCGAIIVAGYQACTSFCATCASSCGAAGVKSCTQASCVVTLTGSGSGADGGSGSGYCSVNTSGQKCECNPPPTSSSSSSSSSGGGYGGGSSSSSGYGSSSSSSGYGGSSSSSGGYGGSSSSSGSGSTWIP